MNTELIEAVKHKDHSHIDTLFAQHQANVQSYLWQWWDSIKIYSVDSNGLTALKWTVLNDDVATAEKLLHFYRTHKMLIPLSGRDTLNDALFAACKHGKIALVKLFLQYGANANVVVDEDSALTISFRPQYVTSINSQDIIEPIFQINENATEIVSLLLKHKANPEMVLPSGRDAISISQNWNGWKNLEITKLLTLNHSVQK